jgi:hypothetical protein
VLGAGRQGTAAGYHVAIIAAAIAEGSIQSGVVLLENARTGTEFVKQAARRGFEVKLDPGSVNEV